MVLVRWRSCSERLFLLISAVVRRSQVASARSTQLALFRAAAFSRSFFCCSSVLVGPSNNRRQVASHNTCRTSADSSHRLGCRFFTSPSLLEIHARRSPKAEAPKPPPACAASKDVGTPSAAQPVERYTRLPEQRSPAPLASGIANPWLFVESSWFGSWVRPLSDLKMAQSNKKSLPIRLEIQCSLSRFPDSSAG